MTLTAEACPICIHQKPLDVVATLEDSWVTMQEAAPVSGYAWGLAHSIPISPLHLFHEAAPSLRGFRKGGRQWPRQGHPRQYKSVELGEQA